MRKIVFVFSPLLVAAAALFACEDESGSSSGGTFAFDSGPGFDGSRPGQDAEPLDAPADTTPSAPPPVTVLAVKSDGTPAQGLTVVFHDAAGAVLESGTTGADGKLASTGATPSMASILLTNGSTKHVITWTAVAAGDVLDARNLDAQNPYTGSYTVTVDAPQVKADQYQASVGTCAGYLFQGTPAPIQVQTYAGCTHAGNDNAILTRVTYQGVDQAYAFKKGNAPPPVDGGTASVAMGTWGAVGSMRITPQNVPAGSGASAHITQIAGAQAFDGDENGFDGPVSFNLATGFADAIQIVGHASPDPTKGVTMVTRIAPADTATIDFANALPLIDEAAIDRKDFVRPTMTWTPAAPLTATKGGSVLISWNKPNEDRRGWTFIVPPGATSVKTPALPTGNEDWLPPDPDGGAFGSFVQGPSVVFVDTTVLPNAAAFRSRAALVLRNDSFNRLQGFALPTNADTLRATDYRYLVVR